MEVCYNIPNDVIYDDLVFLSCSEQERIQRWATLEVGQ